MTGNCPATDPSKRAKRRMDKKHHAGPNTQSRKAGLQRRDSAGKPGSLDDIAFTHEGSVLGSSKMPRTCRQRSPRHVSLDALAAVAAALALQPRAWTVFKIRFIFRTIR